MRPIRFRISTVLMITAIVVALAAFRRLMPGSDSMSIVPFDMLTIILAVILAIFCVMLQALWRK